MQLLFQPTFLNKWNIVSSSIHMLLLAHYLIILTKRHHSSELAVGNQYKSNFIKQLCIPKGIESPRDFYFNEKNSE